MCCHFFPLLWVTEMAHASGCGGAVVLKSLQKSKTWKVWVAFTGIGSTDLALTGKCFTGGGVFAKSRAFSFKINNID